MTASPSAAAARSARADEVVVAARRLLEEEGAGALTMRRLAEQMGIKAPSLYKHLPDKTALEAAIIATGFEEAAARFEAAVEGATTGDPTAGGPTTSGPTTSGPTTSGAATGGAAQGDAAAGGAVVALAAAYREFALAHPHLYRLMHNGPLPRQHLPAGVEERAAAPVLRVAGSRARARALWAFAHGMVMLELDQRFPPDADLDAAWEAGITAFQTG
jgi:AcrR family transcriptional regulator